MNHIIAFLLLRFAHNASGKCGRVDNTVNSEQRMEEECYTCCTVHYKGMHVPFAMVKPETSELAYLTKNLNLKCLSDNLMRHLLSMLQMMRLPFLSKLR